MQTDAFTVETPGHVPAHLVVDFDLYNLPLTNSADPQTALVAFREPDRDFFWTPRNGGHWVCTSAARIRAMQADLERFERAPQVSIPHVPGVGRAFPVQSDPPEHTEFRRPLTVALVPKTIEKLAGKVRSTVIDLIEGFRDRGECEFVGEFAQIFPIVVFLDLMDLPASDRDRLLPLAELLVRGKDLESRFEGYRKMGEYLAPYVQGRMAEPGDDLISKMVTITVNGAPISFMDAMSYAHTVTVAGLDTVAAMLGFTVRHFALHPEQRREAAARFEDEEFCRRAVEEILRRYAIANSSRVARHDMEYEGVALRKGDLVVTSNTFIALDPETVASPMEVDLDRKLPNPHASFDTGVHSCPGASLARRELRIFLEEWFRRIPDFGIKPGTTPVLASGIVSSVLSLEIVWPARD